MKRRTKLLACVLGSLLMAGVVAFYHGLTASPSPGVSVANVHRLRLGMRMNQVEAILGSPGEQILCTKPERLWAADWGGLIGVNEEFRKWESADLVVFVHIEADDRLQWGTFYCADVVGGETYEHNIPFHGTESWFDKLLRWLRL